MEENDQRKLQKAKIPIKEDLNPKEFVVDFLMKKFILSHYDRDTIHSRRTRQEQVDELLNILPRKGPHAFTAFLNALALKDDTLHLFDLLTKDDHDESLPTENPRQPSAAIDSTPAAPNPQVQFHGMQSSAANSTLTPVEVDPCGVRRFAEQNNFQYCRSPTVTCIYAQTANMYPVEGPHARTFSSSQSAAPDPHPSYEGRPHAPPVSNIRFRDEGSDTGRNMYMQQVPPPSYVGWNTSIPQVTHPSYEGRNISAQQVPYPSYEGRNVSIQVPHPSYEGRNVSVQIPHRSNEGWNISVSHTTYEAGHAVDPRCRSPNTDDDRCVLS